MSIVGLLHDFRKFQSVKEVAIELKKRKQRATYSERVTLEAAADVRVQEIKALAA